MKYTSTPSSTLIDTQLAVNDQINSGKTGIDIHMTDAADDNWQVSEYWKMDEYYLPYCLKCHLEECSYDMPECDEQLCPAVIEKKKRYRTVQAINADLALKGKKRLRLIELQKVLDVHGPQSLTELKTLSGVSKSTIYHWEQAGLLDVGSEEYITGRRRIVILGVKDEELQGKTLFAKGGDSGIRSKT